MKYTIIMFFAIVNFSFGQERLYKVKIIDDFKNKMFDVAISLNNSNMDLVTDCNGEIELVAKIGSVIKITKKGYQTQEIILKKRRRLKIKLAYDYEYINKVLEDKHIQTSGSVCTCQPISIINGIPHIATHKIELKKEQVKHVTILKGLDTKPFGKYAASGIIFITTTCDY